MGEDDFFSDDDLDGIPDNTLQELEQHALSSTQRAKSTTLPTQRQFQKQRTNVSIPSRPATANRNTSWRPPQPRPQPLRRAHPQAHLQPLDAPPASAPEPPSSDYGFDDEDVVDLDEPSPIIQPAAAHHARPITAIRPAAAAHSLDGTTAELDAETEAAYAAADAELGAQQWAQAPHLQPKADDGIEVSALQARIAELEVEQARLRHAEQEARNTALAKQGEISIVRANQDKATKEYERRLAVMQKLHADEAAKGKAELEAGRKEREKIATDNRFLQHNLAQETERAKRLNGPGKARAAAAGQEQETPRKAKRNTGRGDGFDDDEVRMISPTKSRDRERQKDQTPKHGAKRKRTANDSPVAALSFTQFAEPVRQNSTEQPLPAPFEQKIAAETVVPRDDDRYEFMQRLLHHSPYEGHERSVEALANYAFPSDPNLSLASTLMDELARSTMHAETDTLPLILSRVLLKLWSRCLELHYYTPLYLILDLLDFTLYTTLAPAIAQLVEVAAPLCIRTIDLVAVPIARLANRAFAASVDRAAQARVAAAIDADDVMALLLRLCRACGLVPGRAEVFWRHMEYEFTLMMLMKAQPVGQVRAALQLLARSALVVAGGTGTGTFGPICGHNDDGELDVDVEARQLQQQARQETATIDRITTLLMEMPAVSADDDEPAYTELEIAELRLEILLVLRAMCRTEHAGLLLARHRLVVGRLIRFLHAQVERLYSLPPPPFRSLGSDDGEIDTLDGAPPPLPRGLGTVDGVDDPALAKHHRTAHTVVVDCINLTVRILHHLLRTYESEIDFAQKLDAVHGTHHKFLICMTRVAFTEKLVFERGIEEEVIEAAHEILNNLLSPDEGEAIVRAVETPRGTRGSGPMSRGEGVENGGGLGEAQGDEDATMSDVR
ncbi:hypothetical protein LTR36_007352 [Oleoguttula mirabilis]|uniref:Uncharacterized protein n=1 Tax=Oleoguttula mirabilis TaxID=1507867 RepID=A0AAV9JAM6_9PEZI|nr:hypothetical protein LTR36_007352 [Oleoguttula mirabilis]